MPRAVDGSAVRSRAAEVQRWLAKAALGVGGLVTYGIATAARVVACASGLERPSRAACVAGMVRGTATIAKRAAGPAFGACLDAAGTAAVLGIATWSVRASAGEEAFRSKLGAAIDEAELRGLCPPLAAHLWRAATIGVELDAELVLGALAAGAVSRGAGAMLGRVRVVRGLELLAAPVDVWRSIGEAALVVDMVVRRA